MRSGTGSIYTPRKGEAGVIWFGLDPISLSSFPTSAIRKVPKGFRIKKLGDMVWQRPPRSGQITANVPDEHTARASSFKRKTGKPDALLKIYRRIANAGLEMLDHLSDEADPLLEKNMRREIDQIIRRKKFAKK